MQTRLAFLSLATLALAGGVAHADAAKEASVIGSFASNVDMMHKKGLGTPKANTKAEPSKCSDAIDASVTGELTNIGFKNWPGAITGKGNQYSIPASKAQEVCDAYATLRNAIVAMAKFDLAKDYAATRHTMDKADYTRTMDVPQADKVGKKCVEDVDAALGAGAPHDVAVNFGDQEMNLDQLRESCVQFIEDQKKAAAGVKGDMDKQNAEIAAVYSKVGIKGDRLKLFTEAGKPEESGFYFAGCKSGPTTAAQMKKAKKLFTWSEGDGYTVTKFVFKGDKYTSSAKTYDKQEKAYAGCK
jgi:hypothetical protein